MIWYILVGVGGFAIGAILQMIRDRAEMDGLAGRCNNLEQIAATLRAAQGELRTGRHGTALERCLREVRN